MRTSAILLIFLAMATAGRAEKLTFAGLKDGESIVIGYASRGCYSSTERKYVVRGGTPVRFEIYEPMPARFRELMYTGPDRLIGSSALTDREALGLDHYLYYLRTERLGRSTNVDDLSLGFYRGEVKLSEEHHVDESGSLSGIYWGEDRKLVYSDWRGDAPLGLSAKTFMSIVPPWVIEQRITRQGPFWEQVAQAK